MGLLVRFAFGKEQFEKKLLKLTLTVFTVVVKLTVILEVSVLAHKLI